MIYFLSRLSNVNKPWFQQSKPWLVIGKGPTFDKIWNLKGEYYTFGLNHVCEQIPVTIGHCIDLDCLTPEFVENSGYVLMPWHPHIKFRVTKDDLNQWACRNELLKECLQNKKLYYYYSSTYKGLCPLEQEIIKVRYFSGEVPFYILGMCGVKKIYSVGIDGGKEYSSEFKDNIPLQNGRRSFDESIIMIHRTCKKFGIEWIRL